MTAFEDRMIKTKEDDGLPEALKDLPCGSVVCVIGAGGKTTTVHQLREYYLKKGFRVLVTTTTHMLPELPVFETADAIKEALRNERYAFGASVVCHKGREKAASLPEDVFRDVISEADMTFIEADGARRLPFKIPKATEPVIVPETTRIVLVAGMRAVSQPVDETVYNAEAYPFEELYLTPEVMAEAYKKTFLNRLKAEWPAVPVTVLAGQADTAERRLYAAGFLEEIDK